MLCLTYRKCLALLTANVLPYLPRLQGLVNVYYMLLQMFLASDLRFLFIEQFRDLVFPISLNLLIICVCNFVSLH